MPEDDNSGGPDVQDVEEGGTSGKHPVVEQIPFFVAPTVDVNKNTFKLQLIPIACWRLNDVRFDFDSSFVLPAAKAEFKELGQLRADHPGAPASIFGHADPTGDDDYNKKLSGRRSEAIYAVLIRDAARWEKIRKEEEQHWGVEATQIMLDALGFNPGEATGQMNPQTKKAVIDFQKKNGLKDDGDPGPKTREKLFLAYMDFLAGDVKLAKSDFLAQGADDGGKGDLQGCSEFNPVLVFSQAEDKEFQKPGKHSDRNKENSPNRRVMILLFRKGSVINPAKWPCPRVSEGTAGCKARFWSDADKRRTPQAKRRHFVDTQDTFGCRFYHRLAVESPCESIGPMTSLLYLKLIKVDDHFAPKQEQLDIRYRIRGFAGKPVKIEITSDYYDSGAVIFSRELTEDEKTDGMHVIQWDGKANCSTGDLKDHYIHPIFSPYKVHLFHDAVWTGELKTKVLYHSIVLKKGPWTPDEAEPPESDEKNWVAYKLNELGYWGGPVGKDFDSYLKKAIIRYKANHKKFHKNLIGDYDDSISADLKSALKAKENNRNIPAFDAVEDAGKKTNVLIEALTYERTSATKTEFGTTRPPHERDRLNRPLIPAEVEIWIRKKDDSKVLEPEAVGPCRIDWTHLDPDEDLSLQYDSTAASPSQTRKYVEKALQQLGGRVGSNGDNCPADFGGIRAAAADNWKTPFLVGDNYVPYTSQEDGGNKVVFSNACTDKDKFPKRFGRAGIMFRPSYIAGDDYTFQAEVSFLSLPNQKELEDFHGYTPDKKSRMRAETGSFTIRRFGKVAMSIDWPARTNDYEWDKIAEDFKKSYLDIDVGGIVRKKITEVLTEKDYKDMIVANTKHKDPAKITFFPNSLVGVSLPAQGNEDADTYKTTLSTFGHTDYNRKIQKPLGNKLDEIIRKEQPAGFIVCNFLLHKPVNIKNDPKKGDNTVTPANTNYITWGGSIGLADSTILADQKDPDKVYYVVSHEMGHNLYLLHWENTGENNPAHHDTKDHNCTMSYSDSDALTAGHLAFQAQGVYTPHFCGKCALNLRGWDVTDAKMVTSS